MDDQEFSGSPSEFLSMRGEAAGESTPTDTDTESESQDVAQPADATDDSFAEEDDGLSPEERVAAVLAQDADEHGEPVAPEPVAEPETPDASAAANDLDAMTPEQLRELAEEALRLREEMAETNIDTEHQKLVGEIAQLDDEAATRVRQRYERTVIATSDAHYGALLDAAEARLFTEAQNQDHPETYFANNLRRVRAPIIKAQRDWEAKQAAQWEAEVEREITAARKQHPGLRRRYAEHLCTENGLPKAAVDRLLRVANTDDMPVVAEELKVSVKQHAQNKRKSNQDLREQAARERAAETVHSPSTGRPASAKPVALKGTEEEWALIRPRR
jgi:hypothetical protein